MVCSNDKAFRDLGWRPNHHGIVADVSTYYSAYVAATERIAAATGDDAGSSSH